MRALEPAATAVPYFDGSQVNKDMWPEWSLPTSNIVRACQLKDGSHSCSVHSEVRILSLEYIFAVSNRVMFSRR